LCRGFFNKALSLSMSTYGLPVCFMFPTFPVCDHPPDNLCRYTKYNTGSGSVSGWLDDAHESCVPALITPWESFFFIYFFIIIIIKAPRRGLGV
jgi:hypothetical protein